MTADAGLANMVRDVLAHLYDPAYLERHPLARLVRSPQPARGLTRAEELRRAILDAIEALNPGDGLPLSAQERRAHVVLFGLYVEGRSQAELADRLCVGTRQIRRDRAVAIQALATVMHDRFLLPGAAVPTELLRDEIERAATGREPVDLALLADDLVALLSGLAHYRGVELRHNTSSQLPRPCTNRTLLRQIVIGISGRVVASARLASLSFEVDHTGDSVCFGLDLTYLPPTRPTDSDLVGAIEPFRALITTLGATARRDVLGGFRARIWLDLPVHEQTLVLVVDDNEDLYELFQRYVVGRPYRLAYAASSDQAIALVQSLRPDVITLDLMMSRRDGWDLLQAIRSSPETSRIPVIICSVLEQQDVARSLGVPICLTKPVARDALLLALEQAAPRH